MIINKMNKSNCADCRHRGVYFCTKSTICFKYEDFRNHMHVDCGMPLTEDGAVHCCECDEPIYKSDYPNHNWEECPVCGYQILEEEGEC